MKLTSEQSDILETIQDPKVDLLKVSAIAGARQNGHISSISCHVQR